MSLRMSPIVMTRVHPCESYPPTSAESIMLYLENKFMDTHMHQHAYHQRKKIVEDLK